MGKRERWDSKVRKEALNGVVVLELEREVVRTPGREAGLRGWKSGSHSLHNGSDNDPGALEQEERSSCGR